MRSAEKLLGRERIKQKKVAKIRWGAALLIAAGLLFLVCEAIAAAAWTDPVYKYSYNFISDLGVSGRVVVDGRLVNSPLPEVMNAGMILHGILMMTGVVLVKNLLPKRQRTVALVAAVVHGIGMIMVGSFHGLDYESLNPHVLGALLAVLAGDFLAIYMGLFLKKRQLAPGLSAASMVIGSAGLLSVLVLLFFPFEYGALLERFAVYSILSWEIGLGVCLILHTFGLLVFHKPSRQPRAAAGERHKTIPR